MSASASAPSLIGWIVVTLSLRATYGPIGPEPWAPSVWLRWEQQHVGVEVIEVEEQLKPRWRGVMGLDPEFTANSMRRPEAKAGTWLSQRVARLTARRAVSRPFETMAHRKGRDQVVGYLPPHDMLMELFPALQRERKNLAPAPQHQPTRVSLAGMLALCPLLFFNAVVGAAGMSTRPKHKARKVDCTKELWATRRRHQDLERARMRPEPKKLSASVCSRLRVMRGPRRR